MERLIQKDIQITRNSGFHLDQSKGKLGLASAHPFAQTHNITTVNDNAKQYRQL